MTPLGIIRSVIKGITQNTTPNELAAGAALGMIAGLVPKANLTAQALLVLIMVFRVNVPLALACAALFSLLNPLADIVAHPIGYRLLAETPALTGLWTYLYNTPVVAWTGFNNTLVLGNLILGIVLFAPVFLTARKLAFLYESRWKTGILNSKFIKAVKASWLVEWYFRVQS